MQSVTVERRRVRVRGRVHNVGFRPFVYGLAVELGLSGWVLRDAAGVVVDAQGPAVALDSFVRRVVTDAPVTAVVDAVSVAPLDPAPGTGFAIADADDVRTPPVPDLAPCHACLAELADPADRRHRHAFIACAACGPRFTLTAEPRPCDACRADRDEPAGRRYRAPWISCDACGPRPEFVDADGGVAATGAAAVARAREVLAEGGVVALKGVGGYQLACDATNAAAVERLRHRRPRGDGPFPVLVEDLAAARELAEVGVVEADHLVTARRPIVLLRPLDATPVAPAVAPRTGRIAVLLPPSPLHVLLLGLPGDAPGPRVLVLTGAALGGEAVVTDDEEAVRRLSGVADGWLRHDRPIAVPCEDSVVEIVDGEPLPVRRSRGEAPLPLALPFDVDPVIAAGGDVRNAFCVAQGHQAWLSAHVGDMDDIATQRAFARAVDHLQDLVGVEPRRLVVDRHPLYRSARGAQEAVDEGGMSLARVQHHHAHIAAVLAENGHDGRVPVVGIAFDDAGHGDDAAVWGGEVLVADYDDYERLAHLAYVPLAGGDATVRRPYRMALAHLHAAGVPWSEDLPCVKVAPVGERSVLSHQVSTGLACVPTSSMGRLIDAIASIAGICHIAGYPGQAVAELQALAEQALRSGADPGRNGQPGAYPLPLLAPVAGAGALEWDVAALVRAAVDDVRAGVPAPVVAVRFHRGVAAAAVRVALHAKARHGLDVVALTGSVFADALLLSLTARGLREAGLRVLRHRRVPPNDGGLALGQVAVGAVRRSASIRLEELVSPGGA
jgi:hydrogenase maturation protein HypF